MFLLGFVLVSLAIGLLRGGNLNNLAGIPFRVSWLIPSGFLVQVFALSPLLEQPGTSQYVPWLYMGSYLILMLAIVFNLHLKALRILGLGLVLNFLAIAANGGYMPASLDQLAISGHARQAENVRAAGHAMNVQAITLETRLAFLGDVFAIPAPVPLSNVFSVGDILIGAGAFGLVYRGLKKGLSC